MFFGFSASVFPKNGGEKQLGFSPHPHNLYIILVYFKMLGNR